MKYGLCADCKEVPLTNSKARACSGCNSLRKYNFVEWWLKFEANRWIESGRPYKSIQTGKNRYAGAIFLFEEQRGVCKFCPRELERPNAPVEVWKRPYIDHNHQTGVTRGLVHSECNMLIGGFENLLSKSTGFTHLSGYLHVDDILEALKTYLTI